MNKEILKPMSRDNYDKFIKTIYADICLFCEYKKYQILIHEWKHWILIQPISPYFKYHVMLCPKKHIKYLSELNKKEQKEFWKADKAICGAYNKIGVKKLRLQVQARFAEKSRIKKRTFPFAHNEHLHIHYYKFREGDFRILVSKTAYKQDMRRLLANLF